MSFAEKVHSRLLALENQVKALDARLKALEKPIELPVVSLPMEVNKELRDAVADTVEWIVPVPLKRGPGRPKKVVNG